MLLTPPGRGAVATILVRGSRAAEQTAACFFPASGRSLCDAALGQIVYGRWGDASGEEVVVCRVGANAVEVHCHGGQAAVARILADLREHGATPRDWRGALQELSATSIQAEAMLALAESTTWRTAAILWDQHEGALLRTLTSLHKQLAAGDTEPAKRQLAHLRERAEFGKHLVTPWRVALVGEPNVGKSSLLNAMLGFGRAIVHDQPGTTRDLVSGLTACDGWPVRLIDTAGLRETSEPIERAGVALTTEMLAEADLVLWVRDATAVVSGIDFTPPVGALVVWNKCDLLSSSAPRDEPGLLVSARTRDGIDALTQTIAARLVPHPPAPGDGTPFTPRHMALLKRLRNRLDDGLVAQAETELATWLAGERQGVLPGEICETD